MNVRVFNFRKKTSGIKLNFSGKLNCINFIVKAITKTHTMK